MALSLEKLMCNEKLMTEMGYAAKEHMKQFSPNKVWNMWDSLIKTTLKKCELFCMTVCVNDVTLYYSR